MGKIRAKSKACVARKKRKEAHQPAPVALDPGPTDGIGPPPALVALRAWLKVARGLLASRAGWTKTQARALRNAKELPSRAKMRLLLIRLQRRQAHLADLEAAEVDRAIAAIRAGYAAEASALTGAIVTLQAAAGAKPQHRAPTLKHKAAKPKAPAQPDRPWVFRSPGQGRVRVASARAFKEVRAAR